jgi:hypothetical protein
MRDGVWDIVNLPKPEADKHTEHTNTLCGQNAEFVPHRKLITSLLQSPTG